MLEKLLLNLKLPKNLSEKQAQNQAQDQPQNQSLDLNVREEKPGESPNLLESFKSDFIFSIDFIIKTTLVIKILMIILPAVFVYSLVLNDLEDRKIAQAEETQGIIESELFSYRDLEASAAKVIGKTDVYKTAKASLTSMSKPLEITLSRIPQNVILETADFTRNRVSLVVRSPSALDFPILISNYFQEKSVSEITLTSAELDVSANQFVMNLDVLFK